MTWQTAHSCIIGLAWLCVSCGAEPAGKESCSRILERIVALELSAHGFRDPALVARRQEQLQHSLSDDLARCERLPLPGGALACIERATSTHEISHVCLR
jgi:hypothetical protein